MATVPAQLDQQTMVTGSSTQRFSAVPIIAYTILVLANSSNIAPVCLGNSGVNYSNCATVLQPGQTHLYDRVDYLNGHEKYDLNLCWWLGATGDKIMVSYTTRV